MPSSPKSRPPRDPINLGPSQRLVGVFVLFILLPGAFLGVLALRVLRQEGQIAKQRARDTLERTSEELVRDLESEYEGWVEAALSAALLKRPLEIRDFPEIAGQAFLEPGGGVFLSLTERGLEIFPPHALSYVLGESERVWRPPGPRPSGLDEAESLELVRKDYPGAARKYQNLLATVDPVSRPLVLQRLARTLRKAGRLEEAVEAYRDLLSLDSVWISGLASDLIARAELLSLASERGDTAGLTRESMTFYQDLVDGKWLLDKPRYLYYSEAARSWCRAGRAADDEFTDLHTTEERKLTLSQAVENFLRNPREVLPCEGRSYLAIRNTDPFAAVILSTNILEKQWWPGILPRRGDALKGVLFAADGSAVFGSPAPEPPPFAVTRDLRIGDTPCLLQLWPGRPEAIYKEIRQSRILYLTLLGFVAVLLIFGGYLTVRIVRRELEIARLKADFVSTVSHEFRSPLTGIKQLGAMLLDGRVTDPEKQKGYFRMIVQESDRLARLVENILDFSRMEEGRREYRFEPFDPSPWLQMLAADFTAEADARGASVETDIPDGLARISADKEALGSAVRNLLDNALKYSPDSKKVWLAAGTEGKNMWISVRDKGVGISEEDQKRVFDRFFRSEGEISKRVKGAGLGLSLVKHVATAHGGSVECRSRVGEGSTFIIRIPAAPVTEGG